MIVDNFYGKDTIKLAEEYCDKIVMQVKKSPELKEQIIRLKKELIAHKLYSFDQYTSIDVYHAVLNQKFCFYISGFIVPFNLCPSIWIVFDDF